MERKLNPPQFDYEPIDFKRKGLWMSSIEGYQEPEVGNTTLVWIATGLMILGIIAALMI